MIIERYEVDAKADQAAARAIAETARKLGVPDGEGAPETWTCPVCGEILNVHRFVWLPGRPPRGFFEPCSCQRDAAEAARAAFIALARAEVADAHWDAAGVPARYRGCRFENFEPRRGTEAALSACRRYAECFALGETETGLLLIGPWGCGKTHLAVATARAVTERSLVKPVFVTAAGLVAAVRAGDGRKLDWSPVEDAVRAELLLLDDLGQENPTPFAREVLYAVVDGRYQARRPTLATSNLGDVQLRDQLGGALVSRLAEMCEPALLTASDYRAERTGGRGN